MNASAQEQNASAKVTVAAAHLSSPMLDKQRGVEKASKWIKEAAASGAQVVVFPETFIPGFPLWNAYLSPIEAHAWFTRLAANALLADGPEIAAIAEVAARNRIVVCLGFTEVAPYSRGCMWNSNILINAEGQVVNLHRKLVPTFYEKLTWTPGDGAGLKVIETSVGRIGTLICGENGNPLARYTLMAQGEELHLSNYPPVWPFRDAEKTDARYDLADAIRFRAAAHAFEAKCFNVVAAGFLDDKSVETLAADNEHAQRILLESPRSVSMVISPSGEVVGDIRRDEEGLVVAQVDLEQILEHKQHHDIAGYYNRFDIFDLRVNRKRLGPIHFTEDDQALNPIENRSMSSVSTKERHSRNNL
jgi:aliphatic nitrilase